MTYPGVGEAIYAAYSDFQRLRHLDQYTEQWPVDVMAKPCLILKAISHSRGQ
jgi:hypothetical protein